MTFEEAAACIRDWCSLTGESDQDYDACMYSTDAETFTIWFLESQEGLFEEPATTPEEYQEMKGRYLRQGESAP